MAQRVRVDLVDDIDGTPADESVAFAVDGVNYVIDLSAANAQKLRDSLAVWIGAARRTGGRRSRGHRPSGGPTANEIRQWAQGEGLEVSARGRVSNEVRAAYEKAHL
ncbi:Lsr2 family protein [Acidipropionibacterium jensenii]|uniref:Lsr2 family protein n=1 Tax=Acidipropionibacterium jensenii TaxID=1749 RepID=A0A3Q9UCG4_9ACTN|nr:Lsr2 family protein [Acidipropionibacterium jensenii]AZZ38716.1 Lsr2 family protein [Acidipropionibacterium jensenii]AZZ41233.1 Lsr2 family protein [Acidipropionibacterium jensenii]